MDVQGRKCPSDEDGSQNFMIYEGTLSRSGTVQAKHMTSVLLLPNSYVD